MTSPFIRAHHHTPVELKTLVAASDHIVKAKVVNSESLWYHDKKLIYTRHDLEIESVFMGVPSDPIISIYTPGGLVEGTLHVFSEEHSLQKENYYYFFLRENEYGELELATRVASVVDISDERVPKVRWDHRDMRLNKFEKRIMNITKFPKLDCPRFFGQGSIRDILLEDRDEMICKQVHAIIDSISAEFSFENVHYDPATNLLTFDIAMETSVPGVNLGHSKFYISYDSDFGTDLVSQGKINMFTHNSLGSQKYPIGYFDHSANTIEVDMVYDETKGLPHAMGSWPSPIVKVEVDLSGLIAQDWFFFDDVEIRGDVTFYCDGDIIPASTIIGDDVINSAIIVDEADIIYTFENVRGILDADGQDEEKIQFDIFVETSEDVSLSTTDIYVNYNIDGFGANAVTSDNIRFIKAGITDPEGYNYLVALNQESMSSFRLNTEDDRLEDAEVIPANTPTLLITIEMDILKCREDKDIYFLEETEDSDLNTFYTGDDLTISEQEFSQVTAQDEIGGKVCCNRSPVIDDFHPKEIVAGDRQILTIEGENFGNYILGVSRVRFRNADCPQPFEMGCEEFMDCHEEDFRWDGILHWEENKIQVMVPSVGADAQIQKPAGKGNFVVVNGCEEKEEKEDIDILYSLINYRIQTNGEERAGQTIRVTTQESHDNGICLSYSNKSPEWFRQLIREGVEAWCKATCINYLIGEEVDIHESAFDGHNVIYPIPREDESGIIKSGSWSFQSYSANTSENITGIGFVQSACSDSPEELAYVMKETDISIAIPFLDEDTPDPEEPDEFTKDRIRNSIIHELGHGHMLNHSFYRSETLDGTDDLATPIMFATTADGDKYMTRMDAEGAGRVFGLSEYLLEECSLLPIGWGNCGQTCGRRPYTHGLNQLVSVFPNPSPGEFFIQFDPQVKGDATLRMYDLNGRLILERDYFDPTLESIELSGPQGMYWIQINHNKESITQKIIKI